MPQLSPIRVAPGGRYFETFDNQPFLMVGANDAITWPGLAGLYRRRDVAGVENYLQSLAENGVTMLRLMLEYAHRDGRYFERRAGTFNPEMVRLWDDLFARCERFGLRVLLAPWDNFWMARRWKNHPYNAANGGPAQSPAAFFTDEATIAATIKRLQFVARRWGGSGAFAAWDLFNEIDPHWGGTASQQGEVIARLSEAVRETELHYHGWTRPQTVSIYGPQPQDDYQELIFRHPSLDFASTHIYHADAIDFPRDTIAPALSMAHWVRYGLERAASRPFTDSEHGPIHLFNNHRKTLPEDFDEEYERHLMWAHLASGGAGSGMRWPARHPHLLTEGMTRALGAMTRFSGALDWRHFSPRVLASEEIEIKANGVLAFACCDETQAVAWLLRGQMQNNPTGLMPHHDALLKLPISLRGWREGAYSVEQWDTSNGCCVGCLTTRATADGLLQFTLPSLHQDLALAIKRL